MRKLSIIFVLILALVSTTSLAQNCGVISAWSYTESTSGTNTTYTIDFDVISTSSNKSVENLIISCGGTTINTNNNCYNQGSSASYSYSFTVATCTSALALNYDGRTNSACGGTTCATNVSAASVFVPVTWLDAYAKCTDNKTSIFWSTASELNNERFVIQKKDDSDNWIDVASHIGKGNSNTISRYEKVLNIVGGIFRIMQIDFDGTVSYSKVFTPKCRDVEPRVYPNPVTNFLHFPVSVQEVSLTTQLGKVVFTFSESSSRIELPQNLESGLYLLRYKLDNKNYFKNILIR